MKTLKLYLVLLSAVILGALPLAGCSDVEYFDVNTLFVTVFDGGYGVAWADKAAADFNAGQEKYKIQINADKIHAGDVVNIINTEMNVGRNEYAYFCAENDFTTAIREGNLADLSDVAAAAAPGDAVTIRSKMHNYDVWKSGASKDGEGLYMLPYGDSIMGFVYDHELFLEMGWLSKAPNDSSVKAELTAQGFSFAEAGGVLTFSSFGGSRYCNYEPGGVILSAGKDGLYGTYDDGQPQTAEEFDTLLNIIASTGAQNGMGNFAPVILSGKYSNSYTTPMLHSTFAQIAGAENYELFYTYDSKGREVTLLDDEGHTYRSVITPETGYLVYRLPGIRQGIDFMYKYANKDAGRAVNYIHPAANMSTDYSHMDAQDKFLMGTAFGATVDNPQSAFLFEGTWWENEARITFDNIAQNGNAGYAYGSRDFRCMLWPSYAEQATPSGQTVFAGFDTGSVVVPKKVHNDPAENEARLRVVKEFIAYTCSNKVLAEFTVATGTFRPYDFTMTGEQFDSLSKFSKNMYSIRQDGEHIRIVRPNVLNIVSPFYYATDRGSNTFQYTMNGVAYKNDYQLLGAIFDYGKTYHADVSNRIADAMIAYSASAWPKYYTDYAAYLNSPRG
jgi:hypothetical protein